MIKSFIPCKLHECRKVSNSNKYLIYFHGNAEDIFNSNYTVDLTRTVLPYNTISVEYPGYSIYSEEKNSETIQQDALIVYDYLISQGIDEKDIVICGRSIGSGPSIYLASNRKPGGLILISPFKSIQEVVKSIIGVFKFLVSERFENIEIVDKITCPTLFIHGQKDDIVPFDHSIELSKKCKCPYEIILPEEMDHNEIHIYDDFLEPVTSFLQRHSLLTIKTENKIEFNEDVYETPKQLEDLEKFKKDNNNDVFTKLVRKLFGV
jgi:fermentation-respiration switch protein FrsA (DUF1100 family)